MTDIIADREGDKRCQYDLGWREFLIDIFQGEKIITGEGQIIKHREQQTQQQQAHRHGGYCRYNILELIMFQFILNDGNRQQKEKQPQEWPKPL